MIGLLIGSLLVLVVLGIPIAFVLGISSLVVLLAMGNVPLTLIAQRMFTSVDSATLLAVPLFMMAGEMMNRGSVGRRIFRFANTIVGRIPGGLGHVNILASIFFAGMSGSAAADAAGLGSIEIPAMTNAGFDREFSAAITAASATIGPVIPPSIIMIIYAVVSEQSVTKLFLAGMVPGIVMGLSLMVYVFIVSRRRGYPRESATFKEMLQALWQSIWALLTPVVIMGGILTGVFTATEAAVIAVVYTLLVSLVVYRDFDIRQIPQLLLSVAKTTSTIMLILGGAGIFAWLLTTLGIPALLQTYLLRAVSSPIVLLLIINGLFLIIGMFLNATAAIILLVPVLLPVVTSFGISLIHFGVIVVMNLVIGSLTPPVGIVLFVTSSVGKVPFDRLLRAVFVPLLFLIAALLIVTFFPAVSMTIPSLIH